MPSVTTQSGQARQDLIDLLKQTRTAVLAEQEHTRRLQEAVDTAAQSATDIGSGVRISTAAWERLRDLASPQT
ncbi:hypothetical protein HY68_01245 [Streptomyces sp. AcH 505]|uniref:hypothetical protein n=1 Tax=Streptomyces sp. AcH 505 TaxID=352211 RepID=UPI0005923CF9|nr:hypothetical protein HY68_01245 [Streptomyces sp. AcH 505]